MRILVAGPFPPAPDPAAAVVLARVGRFLAEGHEVAVISPVPSAAERHGPLAGLKGAALLSRLAPHFDALHIQVSRGVLFRPDVPQFRRILDSVALALALRRWRHTTAEVGDLSDVPGGGGGVSGRIVWPAFDEIDVAGESVRMHAVKVLHLPAAKVRVRQDSQAGPVVPGEGRPGVHPDQSPWRLAPGAGWEDLMSEVRRRAEADRGGNAQASGLPRG